MISITTVAIFVFGLIVGSFVNVLIMRSGFHESARSRSACMACQASLSPIELVPLLSYLLLRGRCRACGSHIALQYPLVEMLVAILFVMTFLMAPAISTPLHGLAMATWFVWWAAFVVLVVVDLRHTLVPLTYAYTLIGAASMVRLLEAGVWMSVAPFVDALFGAVVCGGVIALIVIATRGRGMGSGDTYIAGALGILFGLIRGIEVLALSFWIGAVFGILLLLFKKDVTMKAELPFAPFMFLAVALGAFTTFSPFTLIAAFSNMLLW